VNLLTSHFKDAFKKDVFAGLKMLAVKVWPLPREPKEPKVRRTPNHKRMRLLKAEFVY
jgi:hypothetical protein